MQALQQVAVVVHAAEPGQAPWLQQHWGSWQAWSASCAPWLEPNGLMLQHADWPEGVLPAGHLGG